MTELESLKGKPVNEFLQNPKLRAIAERNLEVAAQCCIDMANRIISLEDLEKPRDYYEAILRLGEVDILPIEFAKKFAPIAGFRNVLVHEYLGIDWNEVYGWLQNLGELYHFAEAITKWLQDRNSGH